jgi:hypothetical protein
MYSRRGEPDSNASQDLTVFHVSVVEARGIDDDDAAVLETWTTWNFLDDGMPKIVCARLQIMAYFHRNWTSHVLEEGIDELQVF